MREGRRKRRRSDDIAAVRPAGGANRKSAGLKKTRTAGVTTHVLKPVFLSHSSVIRGSSSLL